MGRGGVCKSRVPAVDQGFVQAIVDRLAVTKGGFDFGPYERIHRSHAVCARGMLYNCVLLQDLADVSGQA
jgi:hypothetical protein